MKINFKKPFAIIKRKSDPEVILMDGEVLFIDKLEDLPGLDSDINQSNEDKEIFHTISAIPFSQIKERGYEAHDDGFKISCIKIENQISIPFDEMINILPNEKIEFEEEIKYEYEKSEYAEIIKNIIENEIGNGEGANFVIPRKGEAKIADMSDTKALSIFKNLLLQEIGSHWTFIFFDGEKYLIGASPEAHIAVKSNRVKMHPISGTFRKKDLNGNILNSRQKFIEFLKNPKEINELFMVVDEELKVMADLCSEGGMIIGPLLKEMSQLIHTEYLLSGKSKKSIKEILKKSMYAATVTGSPVENACKIIKKYEKKDRRFYSSCLALIGKDENNQDFLDSSILIRSAEINLEGNVYFAAGATLVRDSDPLEETEETESKIQALLNSFKNHSEIRPQSILKHFEEDDEVLELLYSRNQKLSKFWFFNQEDEDNTVALLKNKKVLMIHNEDDFCFMMKHILSSFGMKTDIKRFDEYDFDNNYDLAILGPGPGNPNDENDKKMQKLLEITKNLLENNRKFFAVCLGHQILCKKLGLELVKKEGSSQGIQKEIDWFGKKERVGFYNTFFAKADNSLNNIKLSFDLENKDVYGLKSENFASMQFHPESILTQNGAEILKIALREIFSIF